MSSAIDTTVDFRRKILRFDRPWHPQYLKPTIPKFYSSFFGSWRPYYFGLNCDTQPDWYKSEFPFRNVELNNNVCYTKSTINPFNLNKWIVIIPFLVLLFFLLRR